MKMSNKDRACIYSVIIFILSFYLFAIILSCKKLEFERVVRIKTGEITDVTPNSISITGVVQDWGESGIIKYGHCWSVNPDPTPELTTKTEYDNVILGDFYSNVDSLLPGTTYFIRAYAIAEGDSIYGDIISLITNDATLPTVTTIPAENITDSSATSGGNVTDNGGKPVITRGVCWSISENPTLSDSCTTDGSGTGEFTSNLTGLSVNTTYYVRAYATNDVGTGYGNELSFTTKDVITIIWQKSFGGSEWEKASSIRQTTDGGYIIAGETYSDDGDVSGFKGVVDCWIVKLTSSGELDWQKSLGGSSSEWAYSIQQTTDGGYIMAGGSSSSEGDLSENKGSSDYWIVKLTSTGGIDWQKSFGGSNNEWPHSIRQTTDGGYIIAGTSISEDYDITGYIGWYDFWILKLTSTGQLNWQKSFGGTSGDYAYSVQQTTDGGYIIAGSSYSNDGDVSGNNGDIDYWIVKLTSDGNLDWQKSLGGSSYDEALSVQQTKDGGYIIAGTSASYDGDITGSHGYRDYWIVKLTSDGNLDWQKSLGGSYIENAFSIQQTTDGGYIVAGSSASDDDDVSANKGNRDYWIVKLTATGKIDWEKSLGGSGWDEPYSIQQTTDGGYIIAGESASDNGDVSGNHGETDFWIVKIIEN
jgi:hypothetical protein